MQKDIYYKFYHFIFLYFFYPVQNFKHMQQTNLNAIIERIQRKLNNFTDEDSPTNDTNDKTTHEKPFVSIKKNKKLFQHPHLDNIQYRQSQQIGKRNNLKSAIKSVSTKHIDVMINSPENEKIIKKDKNNINNQELLKGSRSCQNIELDSKKQSISKNISAHIHAQTYLSLRKRNKALEDDVKNLKDRLKIIQQNIEKGKVNTSKVNKSRQNDTRKVNHIYDEKGKSSVRANYMNRSSNIEQKNIKKVPICKSNKFIQAKNGYQMKKNNKTGYEKNHKFSKQDTIKHDISKINQESQNYITFTDKMLKFDLTSPHKDQKYIQKCLTKCKSSKALATTNAGSQETIKELNNRLKHNKSSIADSSISNSSYLRPIQKQKQGNRDKKMELNKKVNKYSRSKLQ